MENKPRCPYCGSYDTERSTSDELIKIGANVVGGFLESYFLGSPGTLTKNYGNKVVDAFLQNYTCNKCKREFSIENGKVQSSQSSFVNLKDYNQGNGGSSTKSSYQNGNSGNANFSNPRQRKFYNELIQISKNKGGFTFNDIPSIKDKAKGFGLDKTEVYKVAIACYWKNGRKPLRSEFSNESSSSGSSTYISSSTPQQPIVKSEKEVLSQQPESMKAKESSTPTDDAEKSEKVYLDEFKGFKENGKISDRERRFLDILATALCISPARQKQLEESVVEPALTDEEQEYYDEVKACLTDDGVISDRERRLLSRLGQSLGLTEEQMRHIESIVK
jgi:hypothetical protein